MSSTAKREKSKEVPRPNLTEIGGLLVFISAAFKAENFITTMKMALCPGDVVVSTYPKCGTSWMQYIVWEIMNDAEPLPKLHDINYNMFPFLEMVGPQILDGRDLPRYMKIHLPFTHFPHDPNVKYIYVARNPKDCCVSIYHFYKQIPGLLPENMTFHDLAENFLEGYLPYGDYFDHVLSWYEHKDEPNVLFLTYEEMKSDPKKSVLSVARFLGKEHQEKLLKNEEMLEQIVKNTTFQNMKRIPYEFNAQGTTLPSKEEREANPGIIVKFQFFRKGTVGDYKNYLTEDLEKRMDDLMMKRLGHTYLADIWKKL